MKDDYRFIRLSHALVQSQAWCQLSPNAVKLFIAVAARYNGSNNGALSFGVREGHAIGLSRSKAMRAFAELEKSGLLVRTKASKWRQAREWRVSMFDDSAHATRDCG